jgi:hypothetical protein
MRHGALPTILRDLRYCGHALPASCLPSTGREPGAPREWLPASPAAFPCLLSRHPVRVRVDVAAAGGRDSTDSCGPDPSHSGSTRSGDG